MFSFLTIDFNYLSNAPLVPAQFNINPTKYGSDINKKCILGFRDFEVIRSNQPQFRFDLNPTVGVVDKF